MEMTDLAKTRLMSQQVGGTKFSSPKMILDWMGAIQSQDYAMAIWAVGIRTPNSTKTGIEAAIDKGEILRTHLLRPTWHFVSSDDIYWMLELTAPQIKRSSKSRQEDLGLSPALLRKCNHVIEKALRGGNHLNREELILELGKAKIATDQNRASHIFAWAELEGLICSGATKRGKPSYAILEERVQKSKPLDKETALATLAKKYFTSRCPATFQDFVWWSGLSTRDAKQALELAGPEFSAKTINLQTYWFPATYLTSNPNDEKVHLLPAYDEFIISYKDRSAALPLETFNTVVSNNGIFRPVIVVNGQVTGIWTRMIGKDKVLVEAELFEPVSKEIRDHIEGATAQYGRYMEKETELTIKFK